MFAGGTNLESITIPDSVTKIRGGAFRFCANLKNIILPDSVKRIGLNAFNGTPLEEKYQQR